MAQEVRNIILTLDEVKLAYECYQRITPDFLPNGTITSCMSKDNAVALTVEMDFGDTQHSSEFIFKGLDVLKPLIRFCIENNIMLPRDGKKSIIFESNCIMLHVELDLSSDMPTSLNSMQMKHMDNAYGRAARA